MNVRDDLSFQFDGVFLCDKLSPKLAFSEKAFIAGMLVGKKERLDVEVLTTEYMTTGKDREYTVCVMTFLGKNGVPHTGVGVAKRNASDANDDEFGCMLALYRAISQDYELYAHN